ncbi:spore cortex biosynthesis protein YabQ [Paenibacillus massiliensis]|uniref:spore cortex biosynthesis protein YabQ n=1 Tax=Paenibacillus massiliensis TaxID=225917 RepID=UPI00039C85E8|nr:spore cortex biosynthesis protein YabQ [Paenibacillus massiliensis]
MSPYTQWITLIWMTLSGAAMGAVFDSYRVLSGRFRFARWTVHILDLLYWILSALFIFYMLYESNRGQLRFYVFLGLVLGVCFYFWLLSVTTQRFVVMLIEIINRFIYILCRIFNVLIIQPLLGIYRLMRALVIGLWRLVILIGRAMIVLLRPFIKLGWWIIRPLVVLIQNRFPKPRWLFRVWNWLQRWWTRT